MQNYNDCKKILYENGNIESKLYYLNNELHRTDGPAFIRYDENGNIRSEHYYLYYKLHRTDGPASIWYFKNGHIKAKSFYLNNKLHRKNGPSIIFYNNKGIKNYYYLYGEEIKVSSLTEFKNYVKHLILK